jgi:hypothetical protein
MPSITALTPAQIALLPTATIAALTTAQIAALTTAQAAALRETYARFMLDQAAGQWGRSNQAPAMPVSRLVAPGPLVPMAQPSPPVARA